jgi:hypothetical protein
MSKQTKTPATLDFEVIAKGASFFEGPVVMPDESLPHLSLPMLRAPRNEWSGAAELVGNQNAERTSGKCSVAGAFKCWIC